MVRSYKQGKKIPPYGEGVYIVESPEKEREKENPYHEKPIGDKTEYDNSVDEVNPNSRIREPKNLRHRVVSALKSSRTFRQRRI